MKDDVYLSQDFLYEIRCIRGKEWGTWGLYIILYEEFFFFIRATPAAYAGSQARGQIGAAAASLHHSSQQLWILNPLSEASN